MVRRQRTHLSPYGTVTHALEWRRDDSMFGLLSPSLLSNRPCATLQKKKKTFLLFLFSSPSSFFSNRTQLASFPHLQIRFWYCRTSKTPQQQPNPQACLLVFRPSFAPALVGRPRRKRGNQDAHPRGHIRHSRHIRRIRGKRENVNTTSEARRTRLQCTLFFHL